jgi:hypothetical protein
LPSEIELVKWTEPEGFGFKLGIVFLLPKEEA